MKARNITGELGGTILPVTDGQQQLGGEAGAPTDDEIVAAIRAAESPAEQRAAWEPLLVRYQPMMFGLCRQMLGNSGPIEDTCHDALVRIMRGFHTFDGKARVSTWIYRVTLNTCLSRLRTLQRERGRATSTETHVKSKQVDASLPTTLGDLLPQSREPDASSSVEQEDQRALVIEALGRLDPDFRSVLLLRDAQGLDYAQISELLEVREGTIKSRIFRARLALRQMVETVRAGRLGPNEIGDETGQSKAPMDER